MAIGFDVFVSLEIKSLLESRYMIANSVVVDFSKTPFRFFGTGLQFEWKGFETKIKAMVGKEKRGLPSYRGPEKRGAQETSPLEIAFKSHFTSCFPLNRISPFSNA